MVPIWLTAWPAPSGIARQIFENANVTPIPRSLKARVVGNIGDVLWVLMGTIGVVLADRVRQRREPVCSCARKAATRSWRFGRRLARAGAASPVPC